MNASNSPSQDTVVLLEAEAAERVRLSKRSLQRGRLEGWGPPFVQLGPRRLGYTIEALDAWLASRTKQSTSQRGAA